MERNNYTFNGIGIKKEEYLNILKMFDSNKIDFEYKVQHLYVNDNIYITHTLKFDSDYDFIKFMKKISINNKHKKK